MVLFDVFSPQPEPKMTTARRIIKVVLAELLILLVALSFFGLGWLILLVSTHFENIVASIIVSLIGVVAGAAGLVVLIASNVIIVKIVRREK